MTKQTNTPELRFPEFENDWKIVKLQELLSFNNGINASKNQYGVGRKFINVLDILNNNFITYNNIIGKVDVSEKVELNNKVEHGDMLFLRSSETREEVGLANTYLDNKYALFGGFVIRGKRIKEYSPLFLKETLNKPRTRYEIGVAAGGSTRFNVSQNILKNVTLYLPELEEQRKISNFFSKLDRQIELEEEKLELLEQQKKGYMQKIFSQELRFKDENNNNYPEWKIKKLEEISEFQNGKAHENFVSDTGKFILVNSKFISTESKVKKYVDKQLTPLRINDIAIVMSDVPNGKALAKCYLIENDNTFTLNQRIGRIFNIEGNSRFLFTQINRNKQLLKYDSGVGQTNLKKSEIIGIKIYWPNKREQDKIGDFFINLDSIIEKQSTKVELLKQRKKGLLQKMFI
ncbi:restriction endonuclease subunit S [Staphylococcus hominis]|uniref:restriction endonuclease subunit S n=1 Tax=Staphylococcus hominis TaxID=1290 RepID=UPI00098AE3D9|nr:restriction endonuclease subunit S [Staphylococcus hominis]TBW91169.1 restriction endonuclease subunit S [Staphylococcus hominis]UNQ68203.1 restriction endonuclease subunit S [Staphylococcus hominis]